MTYLVISAAYFVAFGWRPFIISLDLVNSDVGGHDNVWVCGISKKKYDNASGRITILAR